MDQQEALGTCGMMRSGVLVQRVCAGVRWTWVQIPDLLFMSCGTLNNDVALPTLGFSHQ